MSVHKRGDVFKSQVGEGPSSCDPDERCLLISRTLRGVGGQNYNIVSSEMLKGIRMQVLLILNLTKRQGHLIDFRDLATIPSLENPHIHEHIFALRIPNAIYILISCSETKVI